MGVAASAARGVAALATVVDGAMAFAARGAKDVDARRDNTRRRRVMLSASLKAGVLNSYSSFSSLEAGTAVEIVLGHFLSALLM